MAITVSTNTPKELTDTVAVIQCDVEGSTDDLSAYIPITDILLKNKWKLYNVNRQMISGDYINTENPLRPCQPFVDGNQDNKPFALMGYIFKPMEDTVTINLYEYDVTTVPNLNINEIIITQ